MSTELSRYQDTFGVTFSGRTAKRKSTWQRPMKAKRMKASGINGKLDPARKPRGL